jgi:HEPN domain-containing protein
MKKLIRLVLVTAIVGLIGWRLIRALSREETMENLRKLFGDEWIKEEVLRADPEHPLGRWYRKSPDSSVIRYTEELADFVLNSGRIKCDTSRLASKLKGEFVDTLVELGYAVFLARRGGTVTMEPTAPKSGPDLLVAKDESYYVEMRRVGLDEDHAAVDAATEDVFARLCSTPSRYSIALSMTNDYTAYSPKLKRASRHVASALKDLEAKGWPEAVLYYHGPTDWAVREQDVRNMKFDYSDGAKLAAQMQEFERAREATFVARFYDSGKQQDRTPVSVLSLGNARESLQPDQTYLRLRGILNKKREQIPKNSRGVILLEISALAKLMVNHFTISRALYGDLLLKPVAAVEGEGFDWDMSRVANGFFLGTSRVSAVVVEEADVGKAEIAFNRTVYPTNNPRASVLTLAELELFGTIAEDLENLCAEQLRR